MGKLHSQYNYHFILLTETLQKPSLYNLFNKRNIWGIDEITTDTVNTDLTWSIPTVFAAPESPVDIRWHCLGYVGDRHAGVPVQRHWGQADVGSTSSMIRFAQSCSVGLLFNDISLEIIVLEPFKIIGKSKPFSSLRHFAELTTWNVIMTFSY